MEQRQDRLSEAGGREKSKNQSLITLGLRPAAHTAPTDFRAMGPTRSFSFPGFEGALQPETRRNWGVESHRAPWGSVSPHPPHSCPLSYYLD